MPKKKRKKPKEVKKELMEEEKIIHHEPNKIIDHTKLEENKELSEVKDNGIESLNNVLDPEYIEEIKLPETDILPQIENNEMPKQKLVSPTTLEPSCDASADPVMQFLRTLLSPSTPFIKRKELVMK